MKDEIIKIPIEEVYESAEKYMAVMNGFNREGPAAQKSRDKAMKIREELFDGLDMDVLVSEFSRDSVFEDYFLIEGTRINCSKLPKIEKNIILKGYVFLFHAPMPDLSDYPVSKQYLADSWETAFVDVGRDIVRRRLLERSEQVYGGKLYITDTIAPGMCGIDGSETRKFFEFMDASKINMKILESGMMVPVKSYVGIYLLLDQDVVVKTMNCAECLSGRKRCEYCKNFAEQFI